MKMKLWSLVGMRDRQIGSIGKLFTPKSLAKHQFSHKRL
jgi:hypothetical protein